MRTIRGVITQLRRREGRIGRVWRRIARSRAPLLTKERLGHRLKRTSRAVPHQRQARRGEVKSRSYLVTQGKGGA